MRVMRGLRRGTVRIVSLLLYAVVQIVAVRQIGGAGTQTDDDLLVDRGARVFLVLAGALLDDQTLARFRLFRFSGHFRLLEAIGCGGQVEYGELVLVNRRLLLGPRRNSLMK